MKYKLNDEATMLFHGYGLTSEEVFDIIDIEGDIITLDTSEDEEKCYKFNIKTGKCLNDCNYDGCYRTLKLEN